MKNFLKSLFQRRPNREVKDVLFRHIFKDRKALLSLYNALNGSNYDDPELLEVVTFENAIYMSVKSDLAFVIESTLNLYEHQSTRNPNMPLRGLFYFAQQYEMYLGKEKANIYGKGRVEIPAPRYIVFYNGVEKAPDREVLRLSDSFTRKIDDPALEVTVTVININAGRNAELLNNCRPLLEYSIFIEKIREYERNGRKFEKVVDLAVDYCIEHGILKEILEAHRAEVKKMILTEYNPKEHMKMERAEARAEGRAEGRAESILDFLRDYGEIPAELEARIMSERNSETLRKWLRLAAKAESISAFEKEM